MMHIFAIQVPTYKHFLIPEDQSSFHYPEGRPAYLPKVAGRRLHQLETIE
jgi:hypothetical protein